MTPDEQFKTFCSITITSIQGALRLEEANRPTEVMDVLITAGIAHHKAMAIISNRLIAIEKERVSDDKRFQR
jgi:hypothetical protein